MRVPLSLAADCTDADALLEMTIARFDDAFFEGDRVGRGVLEVEIGVVDLPFEGRVERGGKTRVVERKTVLKEGEGAVGGAAVRVGRTHDGNLSRGDKTDKVKRSGIGRSGVLRRRPRN